MARHCSIMAWQEASRTIRSVIRCSYSFSSSSSAAQEGGRTALVQGASRGLGLEFVRQLLDRPDQRQVPLPSKCMRLIIGLVCLHAQFPGKFACMHGDLVSVMAFMDLQQVHTCHLQGDSCMQKSRPGNTAWRIASPKLWPAGYCAAGLY